MTQKDPAERPTMEEALGQLDDIISSLGIWKLRAQPVRVPGGLIVRPSSLDRVQSTAAHWTRKVKYVVTLKQPLPLMPKTAKRDKAHSSVVSDDDT